MASKNFTPRNTAIGDKLARLLPQNNQSHHSKGKDNRGTRSPMPSPMSVGEDGVDHINIWERGSTTLGTLLAHSTKLSFTHPIFGRFSNIEAFWHYIRSEERDDRIRSMVDLPLKRFANKLTVIRVPNFKAIIMDANWQKVKQYPDLLEALKASTLPLECYYIYRREDGIRIRPTFNYWLIQGFEEIRSALKEDREPNFDALKDNRSMGIYDGVIPKRKEEVHAAEPVAAIDVVMTQADSNELCALLRQTMQPINEEIAPDLSDLPATDDVNVDQVVDGLNQIALKVHELKAELAEGNVSANAIEAVEAQAFVATTPETIAATEAAFELGAQTAMATNASEATVEAVEPEVVAEPIGEVAPIAEPEVEAVVEAVEPELVVEEAEPEVEDVEAEAPEAEMVIPEFTPQMPISDEVVAAIVDANNQMFAGTPLDTRVPSIADAVAEASVADAAAKDNGSIGLVNLSPEMAAVIHASETAIAGVDRLPRQVCSDVPDHGMI